MSKSAKTKVNEQFAGESHQLRVQKIHTIRAAMAGLVYRAGKVTTSKRRQFQVRLNRAQLGATKWSEADRQRAMERLEHEIYHMTPVKHKLFDKLFQHHELQLLQEVWTKATGPRRTFTKRMAPMRSAAEEEVYGAVNMTTN